MLIEAKEFKDNKNKRVEFRFEIALRLYVLKVQFQTSISSIRRLPSKTTWSLDLGTACIWAIHTWYNLHPATYVKNTRRLHKQQTDQKEYCEQGQANGADHEESSQL